MKKWVWGGAVMVALCAFSFFGACDFFEPEQKTARQSDEKEAVMELPKNERKRVLILHSYHPEYTWVSDINHGIIRGLKEERFYPGKTVEIEYFYMDTKRKSSAQWKLEVSEKALDKIKAWKPDVVLAADDNAQAYVVSKMKDSETPFVFLGVNADPRKYGYVEDLDNPGHNVTGCIERERFDGSMKVLRRMVPGVSRISIVCDDGPTGVPIIQRTKALAPRLGVDIVEARQIGTFSAWKRFVADQQDKADALLVIVYHTLRDDGGNHVDENEVLHWTISNSNLPDLGFWAWAIEGGLLCSEAISGYEQGYHSATLASYVLRGQDAGRFKIQRPTRGEICINRKRAEMLGIEIPADLRSTATIYGSIGSEKAR